VPSGYTIQQINTGAFPLVQPDGLAVGEDNSIYVGRNFFTGVSDLLRITSSGDVAPIASFPTFIGGLTLDSAGTLFGSLFASDGSASVFKIEAGTVSTFASGLPCCAAEGLAFSPSGDLYVANFNDGSISKVAPNGGVSTFLGGLGGPFGVAFRGNSLFVGDNANNGIGPGVVLEVAPDGSILSSLGPISGRIIALQYDPYSDSFFIANQGDPFGVGSGIDQLLPDGQLLPFATGFQEYPRDIALGPNGSLYVVDASSLYEITAVPEANTFWMLAVGLGLGVGIHRRVRARGPIPVHRRKPLTARRTAS
jgi:DNA-binding beta-propeller fold protein YncE